MMYCDILSSPFKYGERIHILMISAKFFGRNSQMFFGQKLRGTGYILPVLPGKKQGLEGIFWLYVLCAQKYIEKTDYFHKLVAIKQNAEPIEHFTIQEKTLFP